MNGIFFLSVILKGAGAVLEVLLQVLITRKLGVDGYGTFSTWINSADLIFWIFFSALTKCNTYYLSADRVSIRKFRKKYYLRYVAPFLVAASVGAVFLGKGEYGFVFLITGLELLAMDQSSTLLAQRHQMVSLVGEYVLGRLILVVGFGILQSSNHLSITALMLLYAFQYAVIVLTFTIFRKRKLGGENDISDTV